MKKILNLLLVFVLCFCLFSCTVEEKGPDYEAIDEVVQCIDLLPRKITLDDEEDINAYYALYNALTDEEKELVENYSVLDKALRKIEYLKNESDHIHEELVKISNQILENIPDTMPVDVKTIELESSYSASNEFASYLFHATWTSSDPNALSAQNKTVNHSTVDKTVTLTCSLRSTYNNETYTFSKEIFIEKMEFENLSSQVVTAYYYGSSGSFTELDYNTLDMIVYSFAQIAKRTNNSGETEFYVDGSGLREFNKMAEARSHGVRVLFSLGGWHDDRSFWDVYKECAGNETYRKQIANSILNFLEENHLDGIDMDWEYPSSSDKYNFTALMREIYNTLKEANPNYIVSAAIPSGTWISSNYDLRNLNACLDFINIMSYDLDDGSKTTHHTSYSKMVSGINYMINNGVDKAKIVCGAAFYGRLFKDVKNTNNGLNQTYSSKETIKFSDIYRNYLQGKIEGNKKIFYDESANAYY